MGPLEGLLPLKLLEVEGQVNKMGEVGKNMDSIHHDWHNSLPYQLLYCDLLHVGCDSYIFNSGK